LNISTGWVKKPQRIRGLDHLAVQAPCINLYGQMLPGITNVTDRGRYYSFYPWIIRALEKAGHTYNQTFINLFRRADCLFTLIAHQHANISEGDYSIHSGATTGSANLSNAIQEIKQDQAIKLSDYADLSDDVKQRYFKNKLGGIGQYYLGVFRELDMMRGSIASGVKNTEEMGLKVAEVFAQNSDHDLFIKTLKEDVVTVERLNELADFCQCQIVNNPAEQKILCDLFFVTGDFFDPEMLERRNTLQAILLLADLLAGVGKELDLKSFRGCVYSGALPGGAAIELPDRLKPILQRWSIYQRNELLSLSLQGLFFVLLDAYSESGNKLDSSQKICEWYVQSGEVDEATPFDIKSVTFSDAKTIISKELASIQNWVDENHEVQAAFEVESLCRQEKTSENRIKILKECFKIISALCSRGCFPKGYGDFTFIRKNYLNYYTINLQAFDYYAENTWPEMNFYEWLLWMFKKWGIEAHLKVALRKLRGQSQSTFRIKPSDQGFEVIETPGAVYTSPRFRQALQVLIDIGALERKGDTVVSTDLGKSLREIQND